MLPVHQHPDTAEGLGHGDTAAGGTRTAGGTQTAGGTHPHSPLPGWPCSWRRRFCRRCPSRSWWDRRTCAPRPAKGGRGCCSRRCWSCRDGQELGGTGRQPRVGPKEGTLRVAREPPTVRPISPHIPSRTPCPSRRPFAIVPGTHRQVGGRGGRCGCPWDGAAC